MNYYEEAIRILENNLISHRKIIVELAKKHPKYLYEAYIETSGDWKIKAFDLYINQGLKIKAIKHCKNMTGLSLKEAKEAVEGLS